MRRVLISTALFIVSLSAAALTAKAQQTREVILAIGRDHRLVVFDARTLAQIGYFTVNYGAHSVSASPNGRTLFIEQPPPSHPRSCCALFSLDLATGAICELIFPSSPAVPTPDGRRLFTQRGAIGVDAFETSNFSRLPTLKAPGNYSLSVSPDSRWMFGTTNWQGPSLDVFDLEQGIMVRRQAVPAASFPRGAWLGEKYYLFASDGRHGNLWSLTPETTALDAPTKIALPGLSEKEPGFYELLAGGDRLVVYERLGWWLKLDRRSSNKDAQGGIFLIERETGEFVHLAASIDFYQLIASADGRHLYGLNAGTREGARPSLIKLNTATGEVLKRRLLARDVWHISAARIPESLLPRGRVATTFCQSVPASQ